MDVNSHAIKKWLIENRQFMKEIDKHQIKYGYYKQQKSMPYELVDKLYKRVSEYRQKTYYCTDSLREHVIKIPEDLKNAAIEATLTQVSQLTEILKELRDKTQLALDIIQPLLTLGNYLWDEKILHIGIMDTISAEVHSHIFFILREIEKINECEKTIDEEQEQYKKYSTEMIKNKEIAP